MKLFLIALLCACFTTISYSQEVSNKQRLAELPELIEKEAAKENFEVAAKLQKELEIRENLEVAIKDKDYKKAAQLREELNNLDKEPAKTPTASNSPRVPTPSKSNKNSIFYVDFTLAGMSMYSYEHTTYTPMYDEFGYYIGTIENDETRRDLMYSINIKLGSKFYFGPGDKKFRVGLDVNYLSLNLGINNANSSGVIPNLNLSLARPGAFCTLFFNEQMGLDFQVNGGLMLVLSQYNDTPLPMLGYSVNPQLKYWYKNIGVGLEYNFGSLPNNDVRYQHFGLSFGLRF